MAGVESEVSDTAWDGFTKKRVQLSKNQGSWVAFWTSQLMRVVGFEL
jgi:hypothetical protein